MQYVNTKAKPTIKNYLIVTFEGKARGRTSLKSVANSAAALSSFGLEFDTKDLTKTAQKHYKPIVFFISTKKNQFKIAYPQKMFEAGSIPHLLAILSGSIFNSDIFTYIKILDIEFSSKYIKSYPGPKYGISGLQKWLHQENRPLLTTTILPKLSLTAKQVATAASYLWEQGIDIVQDSELLVNLSDNTIYDRVIKVLKERNALQRKLDVKKMYLFNITGTPDKIYERSDYIMKLGGKGVLIDVVTTGFDNLQLMRKSNLPLMVLGHRTGHGLYTRDKKTGFSLYVLAKLARLAGVDMMHINQIDNTLFKHTAKDKDIQNILHEDHGMNIFKEDWSSKQTVMPIVSGNLNPSHFEKIIKVFGNECIIDCSHMIFAHPKGYKTGVKACKAAFDHIVEGGKTSELKKLSKGVEQSLKIK